MPKILTIIPTQGFELIRDRIGSILADEVKNQAVLTSNPDLINDVWIERTISFNKTELPAINVSLASGNFNNENQGSTDGSYQFNIDVYTDAKTTDNESGDTLAMVKLHKLLGLCRAILKNPIYKTLGFTPPFIGRVSYSDLNIADTTKDDALSTGMGRLTLTVLCNEITGLLTAHTLAGYNSIFKLSLTDKGHLFKSS